MSIPLQRGLSGALGQLSHWARMAQALVQVWNGSGCPILQLGSTQGLGRCKAPPQGSPGAPLLYFSFGTQRGMRVAGGAAALCPPRGDMLSPGRSRLWTPQLPPRPTSVLEPCAPTDPHLQRSHQPASAGTACGQRSPPRKKQKVFSVSCAAGGWAQ